MPLVDNERRQYYTIDTDEVAFKAQVDGETMYSPFYEGYLVDVEYREDDYKGNPANKYQFIFATEDGEREIVQSGESSVFSGNMINVLLSVDGQYGKLKIGIYQPDGKDFIAAWVDHNGERLEWKHEHEAVKKSARQKTDGDLTLWWKKMFETVLKPKIAEQGTVGEEYLDAPDPEEEPVDPGGVGDESLDDIDDDLPF